MKSLALSLDFRHEPLPDSTSHIRLLEIVRGDLEDQVVCKLTTWPLESAPSYYALSYTWGDEASTARIIINHRESSVRANCEFVMRQAYASGASRYFWIDAICIDQASTQEKNHQVAMMGQLYRRAAHVFACIGPHADDSEFVLETIDKHNSLFASLHSHTSNTGVNSRGGWFIPNPIPTRRWLALRCFFTMNAQVRKRLANGFIALMRRSYFSRVWVLQELHLASKISLCCGTDIRSFDHLLAVSMLVDFWINEAQHRSSLRGVTRIVASLLSRQSWTMRRQKSCISLQSDFSAIQPQRGCLALGSGARGPRRLAEVLEAMQHFQCADIRDKLYGVLALVDWHGAPALVPDYGKDSFEVATMILETYLANRACAPVSGMVIEWPRRLREVFEITPEQKAMRKAIRVRYHGTQIPKVMAMTHGLAGSNVNNMIHSHNGGPRATVQPSDLRRRGLRRRGKKTWYGIRLHHSRNIECSILAQPRYLCCRRNHRQLLIEIVDQQGNVLAFAPEGTKAGDWFLISDRGSLTERNAIVIIVRLSNSDDDKYTIVGQASMYHEYGEEIFPLLDWEYFTPRWHPEDLLLLDWSYVNRELCEQSRDIIADWLKLRVCVGEGSSYADGPPLYPQMYYNLGLKTPRYTLRNPSLRILSLETPFSSTDDDWDAAFSSDGE